MSFQHNYRTLVKLIFASIFSAVVFLSLCRMVFFLAVEGLSLISIASDDVWRMFWVGGRFDLKVVAIAFAPLFLSGLICGSSSKKFGIVKAVIPSYTASIFFLLCIFSIGNYYYYVTYGNHFDLFVFGLFDDDTAAVLSSVWVDYPILISLLFSLGIAYLSYKYASYGVKCSEKWKWPRHHAGLITVSVVVVIFCYVAGARGSLGSLPLKRYHASVSQHKILNVLSPNAFMALDWARSDYTEQFNFKPVPEALVKQQMIKVLGKDNPQYQTPQNDYLAENPPHVVMALMEGMGNNVLIEDDPHKNDLLGALRPHFEQDYVYKRFLAGTSATIDSIVMMLFHSNVATLSHSMAQKTSLPSSAVMPYKAAGYDVVFIYGGNSMWRNLANYLPKQGFDRVFDENSIIEAFPEAESYQSTWGIPDEYTFKFARKILDEASKPTFVYIMTVTNHSPFMVPDNYAAKPITVSARVSNLLGPLSDEAEAMLHTYQYSNNALGEFIQGVKTSPLAAKTLIGASGDHRMRYLATDKSEEYGLTYGVPFYLYVPDVIKQQSDIVYDEQRIGSHRDILPTLYHHSLSDSSYVSLGGENMLSSKPTANIGYNKLRTITSIGAFNNKEGALVYPWSTALYSSAQGLEGLDTVWGVEYNKLQDYYLRSQLQAY
ncbi:LTA synthase family protein [Vibrio rotiferianus]|uniref:LTA synthase family protein n=1 Tax=Vibrio rotiferianus TaxID=190895 RepID=UPI00406A4899